MSFSFSNLVFSPSTGLFYTGVIALLIIGSLCIIAWKRAGSRPLRTGLLELLRFLIATVIVLMLWKPEWRTVIHPEDNPEIAILWDGSGSMTTQDVQLPAWLDADKSLTTRADYAKKLVEAPFWKPLEDGGNVKLFFSDFSSVPEDIKPEDRAKLGSDLRSPLENLAETHDNLRAVILLSDGSHNIAADSSNASSSPTAAAQKLLLKNTPLFTVPIGAETSLPDLDLVNYSAPDFGIVGEFVQIPYSIQSSLDKDIRTTINLKDENGAPKTETITIPANKTFHGSILWQLADEGSTKLTLSVPVARGELNSTNNSQSFIIGAKKESIRALVIETKPRWEYRFIRNALSRDPGVKLDCLLLHPNIGKGDGPDYIQEFPNKLEDLQKYDVIFFGDVGVGKDQLTKEQVNLLAGLVREQASGIVFIPGPQGNQATLQGTDLEELIPVIIDSKHPKGLSDSTPSPLNLTKDGKSSLLTLLGDNETENPKIWRNLPGFHWFAAVEKIKADATVLATHSNRKNSYGSIPLLVTKQAGSGKALFLGHDSAWRWRRGVEDLYHFRFWKNVARWMSYQRNMAAGERIRLYRTPDRPKPGDTVTLSANAFDANGVPLREGNVEVEVTNPDGQKATQILERTDGTWGAFTGRFVIQQPGEWKITAKIEDDPAAKSVSTSVISIGQELEKIGKPTNPNLLNEMAKITKGQMIQPDQLNKISDIINALPIKKSIETRYPIWAHIALLITLIVLLGLFWTGRKLNGTF